MTITVKRISWTRTFLNIEYTATDGDRLVLYRKKSDDFRYFMETKAPDGSVHATINVVIANEREPLPAGDWILCVRTPEKLLEENELLLERVEKYDVNVRKRPADEEPEMFGPDVKRLQPYDYLDIEYTQDVLLSLEGLSQAFRYASGKYMYTASFIPRMGKSNYLYVVLFMGFYVRNEHPEERPESKRWRQKNILAHVGGFFARRAHRDGKHVLFFKENGLEPTANMRAVIDRIYERGLDKEFTITQRYRNTFDRRHQSLGEWLKDLRLIAQSDYIFIDDYCPVFNFVVPPKGSVLTQIWHAGVGFKSVGYARFGITASPDPYNSGHRRYTYALVGNKYLRDIYSEVFGIEKEALLATGMPRLDYFLDEEGIEAARAELIEKYPWINEGRVITFAPTFRGSGQRSAYYPYQTFLDMERLFKMCEETNSYFVFEMHHFIKQLPEIPEEYQSRLIDLSDESLDKLYHVTDVLVTDYSSCFYDFLLLEKPVVFYTPDRIEYSVTRGVQRPVDQMAPGKVCDTFDQFISTLETRDYADVAPDPSCIDRALERSGLASDRVIDTILLGRDVPGVRMKPGE